MFMFRSKRTSLIRRLLRARKINETLSENEELLRTHIISNLRDSQLELLVEIIENHGHDSRTCIPIRKTSKNNRQSTTTRSSSFRNSNIDTSNSEGGSSENNCFSCCVASSPPPPNFSATRSGARQTPTSPLVETSSPPPHVLCCQTYRWPELKNFNELKKLPQCSCDYNSSRNSDTDNDDDEDEEDNENVYICCNPYHWSRLCGPESPPPPYRRYPEEKLRPEDRAPSEGKIPPSVSSSSTSSASPCSGRRVNQGSLPTSGDGGAGKCGGAGEWCKLAYWELQRRVGALFPVCSSTVHVFSSPPQPGCASASLCLADLSGQQLSLPATAGQQATTSEAVKRTRTKIGLGVMLSQESDGVWAYNLSDGPMFVNSPTLDEPHSRTLVVYKLPPGSCLRIFDWERAARNRPALDPACGPVDPHSVRISFAKGWGPKYSRQEVTACPCWLEVLLVPPR